jgi:RHS repeat-associated protein
VQNTYDTNELGTQGSTDFPVGQLTRSVATTYYPDSTSATVTEQAQYDQRGRPITGQIQLGVPSSWGLTTTLPTYQLSQVYNDADQPTTTTISSSDGNADYTFTPIYDSTNGVEQGLSNNSSSTANLATIAYNEFAQLASITYLPPAGTSGTTLAEEQFGYDGDLRPISEQATWLPGSGNSGTILDQSLTYDNAGNVTGETTQMASVPGQSGSGGSETQNFCYDEQNRMVWAGDGGTQPGAGNGTCGSGTLSNSLSGAGYTSSYVFTNLGQIWQGPLNNSTTQYQYLYCNNNPHELTGVYPIGTTCSNRSGATPVYSASYDPWGNETSRTYNGVTETLSYDAFNDLVEESGTNSTQEQYVYDASGERVLKRSTSGSVTTLTVEAFSSQELTYSSSGVFSSQADYYGFGPLLIGATNGSSTTYYLTDTQGNVLTSFSAVASSAAVQGNQLYSPYGTQRYQQGSTGTDLGYMGRINDSVTGLDYDNARYYDPVTGMFISADDIQGNAQGMNPYAYVAGNPKTYVDPSGHMITDNDFDAAESMGPTNGGGGGGGPDLGALVAVFYAIHMWMVEITPHNPRFGNYGEAPPSDPFVGNSDFPVPTPGPSAVPPPDTAEAPQPASGGAIIPPRPPHPLLPTGMNVQRFAELVGWGKAQGPRKLGPSGQSLEGYINALDRLDSLTPADIRAMADENITQQIVQTWIDTYTWDAKYRHNITAIARAALMRIIYKWLGII